MNEEKIPLVQVTTDFTLIPSVAMNYGIGNSLSWFSLYQADVLGFQYVAGYFWSKSKIIICWVNNQIYLPQITFLSV